MFVLVFVFVFVFVFVLPSLACVSSQGEMRPTRNNSIKENAEDLTKKFNSSWFV